MAKGKHNFAVRTWLELLDWTDRRYPMADRMLEYLKMPHADSFGQVEYQQLQQASDAIDDHLTRCDGNKEQAKQLEDLKQQYYAAWRAIADRFRATFYARETQQAPSAQKRLRAQKGRDAVGEISAPQLNDRGDNMGVAIDVRPTPKPGHYTARIASIEATEGKFGPQLKIQFDLGGSMELTSFFPAKATSKNKTGELLKASLGKLQSLPDSDILLNCKLNVLLEQAEGRDYPAIKSMWSVAEDQQEAIPY
jgi:hypothetical protein